MNEKYKNKYRIPSARYENWDYSQPGAYFITVCIADRSHKFGEIVDKKMILSQAGVIVNLLWHGTIYHTKNVELGAFIVMPNHFHGILILNDCPSYEKQPKEKNKAQIDNLESSEQEKFPIDIKKKEQVKESNQIGEDSKKLIVPKNEFMSSISPKAGSVSRIMGSYTSAITAHTNRLGFEVNLQKRFWDVIIRTPQSFATIENYILTNVENWENDKFFPK